MPLRYTLRQLEYFVAVGEVGSIAKASERVAVSSPSISAAISALEAEFGVQLFVRQHAQGLSLTPGGRRVFKEAKRILEQGRALYDVTGDISSKAGGPLAVGCFITLAPFILPSLRKSFESSYPEARVTQTVTDQARLLDMLRRAEIDVAITYDMELPQDIAFTPLAALPPYVLIAADHPWARRGQVSLEDLLEVPMVLLDLPISREYFLTMFHAHGFRPLIGERTSDLPVLRSLVANGYGYAVLNIRSRTDAAPDGTPLTMVDLEGDFTPLRLGLARMRSERTTRITQAFEDHCRERVRDNTIPGMAAEG
ncbi:MAG: LysR family transcriptional regulator [Pseudomonadota bacterium]